MIRLILFCLSICFFDFAFGQDISIARLSPVKSFAIEGNTIYCDNLNALYIVSGAEIKKYNTDGKLLCNYENPQLGDVTYIDVSDPFKTLVFYRQFNSFLILDNTLSPVTGVLETGKYGFTTGSLICSSSDNAFWVYDPYTFQVSKIRLNGQRISKSDNINVILGKQFDPVKITEMDHKVFLIDTTAGSVILDQFANFINIYPYCLHQGLQLFKQFVFIPANDGMKIFDLRYKESYIIAFDRKIASDYCLSFTSSGIFLYSPDRNQCTIYRIENNLSGLLGK